MKRNVVHAFTTLGEKLGDGRVVGSGLQQLDPALAAWDHRDLNFFRFDGFFAMNLEAEVLVKLAGHGERFDGDTEMIDGVGHDSSVCQYISVSELLAISC